MSVSSLVSTILVTFLCSPCKGGEYGELRIDFGEHYYQYQNITKVIYCSVANHRNGSANTGRHTSPTTLCTAEDGSQDYDDCGVCPATLSGQCRLPINEPWADKGRDHRVQKQDWISAATGREAGTNMTVPLTNFLLLTQVFQVNKTLWLLGMNYQYKTHACVYFTTENLQAKALNYTYHVKVNNTWQAHPHYATFFTDNGTEYDYVKTPRRAPNSMKAVKSKDNPDIRNYRLVYGAADCYIFRRPGELHGMGCMVLLGDDVVSNGMDKNCTSIYRGACGNSPHFRTVFDQSCKRNNQTTPLSQG